MHAGTTGLMALTDDLGVLFGGDYNPEQWDRAVWDEDVALMRAAGVNLVTVGVFAWARYEPSPGEYDFAWLGEVLDLLHANGIAVDLATPVASPPPWLGHREPSTLPIDADGVTNWWGSRNQFCPFAPAYRDAALSITKQLATRFVGHPAIRMWHAGNEYGQSCHCDLAAAGFRDWLRARYGSIAALNEAWSTVVWSQAYSDWDEVLPPRRAPYHHNPALELDFRRCVSDTLLDCYSAQRAVIRASDPTRPITTNLMGFFAGLDPVPWLDDLDIVADDAYPDPASPTGPADAAFTNALARGLARGPWMRMEQATSAVSWREHNLVKSPERLRAEVIQSIAHGCDAVCFFQWRQARTGPERFHSAMLPNAGADTAVHRGVRRIGDELACLRGVVGTDVVANAAVLWDWQSWWVGTQAALPSARLDPLRVAADWHRSLGRIGITVDVVDPSRIGDHDLLVVPALTVLEPQTAAALEDFVVAGGTLVWGPFSGVHDANAALHQGRSPRLLTGLLGVSAEEWVPLPDGGSVVLETDGTTVHAVTLGERTRSDAAEVLGRYAGGPLDGAVAVARNRIGSGTAWYVGADLAAGLDDILAAASDEAGLSRVDAAADVEVVVRGAYVFVLNLCERSTGINLANLRAADHVAAVLGTGPVHDVLAHVTLGDNLTLSPWGVAVLETALHATAHTHPTPSDSTSTPEPGDR